MMCTILVSAQVFENYSDTDIPYWKAKGGSDFLFPVQCDTVLNIFESTLRIALSKMVDEQSNEKYRYEYFSHVVNFSQPKVVEGLDEELGRMFLK